LERLRVEANRVAADLRADGDEPRVLEKCELAGDTG